jgi:hypothetical protein
MFDKVRGWVEVAILGAAIVLLSSSALVACSGATPSATTAPTPTVAITTTSAPTTGLTFGTLTYTPSACITSSQDPQGHTISGVEIDFALPVTNSGTAASHPVWFIIEPVGVTGPAGIQVLHLGDFEASYDIDRGVGLQGPAVAAGKSVTLKAVVFVNLTYRVAFDFNAYASVSSTSDLSSLTAGRQRSWRGLETKVEAC